MRTILFFDLPSVTKTDHKEYAKFIKLIKSKGFIQLQESVYSKLSLNESVANASISEIKKHLPREGMVSVLTLTETQFASMEHILGEPNTDVIINEDKIIKL